MTDIELEQLNHAIAAIAGYTDIKHLDTSRNQEIQPKKKLFVGTNTFTESKSLIPDYVGDLNAITRVFRTLEIPFDFAYSPNANIDNELFIALSSLRYRQESSNPAIALCKLLVAIHGD